MKKELVIEWKHIGNEIEKTAEEFEETGMTLSAVLAEIRMLLEMEGGSASGWTRPSSPPMMPPPQDRSASSSTASRSRNSWRGGRGDDHVLLLRILRLLRGGKRGVPDAPLQRRGVRGNPAGTDRAGGRKSARNGVRP